MKTFSKHERLAETENGDVLVIFCLSVVLGVLRLAADLMVGPVVLPGDHRDIPLVLTCTNIIPLPHTLQLSVSYPQCSEPLSGSRLC